jgi:hypothetical protein
VSHFCLLIGQETQAPASEVSHFGLSAGQATHVSVPEFHFGFSVVHFASMQVDVFESHFCRLDGQASQVLVAALSFGLANGHVEMHAEVEGLQFGALVGQASQADFPLFHLGKAVGQVSQALVAELSFGLVSGQFLTHSEVEGSQFGAVVGQVSQADFPLFHFGRAVGQTSQLEVFVFQYGIFEL